MKAHRQDRPQLETRKDTLANGALLLTAVLGIFFGAFTLGYHQVAQAAPVHNIISGGERG